MKKIVTLIIVMLFSIPLLCGCHATTVDEFGETVKGRNGMVFIERIDGSLWLAYDRETKVVFYYDNDGENTGVLSNYYIYQNGAIYGAIYEDEEIKPIPFATITP